MKSILIVGAGIIGLSIALELSSKYIVTIIEKSPTIAPAASSRNSGVIHTSFHLKPGSLKARFCNEGRRLLLEFCKINKIPFIECGKFVVALNDDEVRRAKIYEKWARQNGDEIEIMDQREFNKYEPNARCTLAIYAKRAAVTNPRSVSLKIFEILKSKKVRIFNNCKLMSISNKDKIIARTNLGEFKTDYLINCAGTYADKIAKKIGFSKNFSIVPIRGEYFVLKKDFSRLVNSMIYRMPNPDLPFLGVHFTKRIDGLVMLGPNASLAFGRESYSLRDLKILEFSEIIASKRFLKLMMNKSFLRLSIKEFIKSISPNHFIKEMKEILPILNVKMLDRFFSGIRAQLIDDKGKLVDDFVIEYDNSSLHILNAVSPGFTSSFSFAKYVASKVEEILS